MKLARRIVKSIFLLLLSLDAAIFVMIYMMGEGVAESYRINPGDTLRFETDIPVTAVVEGARQNSFEMSDVGESFSVDLKMFGLIPFSKVDVEVVDEMYVAVLGSPFGMKLYTDGVLVVDMADVETAEGFKNPALDSGIKIGDYIRSANGITVSCNEDLAEIVEESGGRSVRLETVRNGTTVYRNIVPELSVQGSYRIGAWVRDSSAGIGTLTFYSPSSGIVCGLGHGICDSDTDELLTLNSGELVGAEILSVEKGSDGSPGELKGRFTAEGICSISLNAKNGVYGSLSGSVDASRLAEIAHKQDVKNGKAEILCTVDDKEPQLYTCEIEKRENAFNSPTQNLIVTVTDPRLISATGGIVQGMSGSPILQNGKLIGAVTHVLVDDSCKGYGIFAENMLDTAQSVGNDLRVVPQKQLKDAS